MRDRKVSQCGMSHGSSWGLSACLARRLWLGVNSPNGYGLDWLRCV